jgi:MYXO-CTERM domain-containing protein
VTEYTDFALWSEAVNDQLTTIDFTGYPDGMFVTDLYEALGITFIDGNDNIYLVPPPTFHDGAGIDGNNHTTLSFALPIHWIAVDHPGHVTFELFNNGEPFYFSTVMGGGGTGFFSGVISDTAFDMVIIDDPFGEVAFDDLHFGPPIPAPAALALLALAGLRGSRRRIHQRG